MRDTRANGPGVALIWCSAGAMMNSSSSHIARPRPRFIQCKHTSTPEKPPSGLTRQNFEGLCRRRVTLVAISRMGYQHRRLAAPVAAAAVLLLLAAAAVAVDARPQALAVKRQHRPVVRESPTMRRAFRYAAAAPLRAAARAAAFGPRAQGTDWTSDGRGAYSASFPPSFAARAWPSAAAAQNCCPLLTRTPPLLRAVACLLAACLLSSRLLAPRPAARATVALFLLLLPALPCAPRPTTPPANTRPPSPCTVPATNTDQTTQKNKL